MLDDKEKKLIYIVGAIIIALLIVVIVIIWSSAFSGGKKTADITSVNIYEDGHYKDSIKEKYKTIVLQCINEDNFDSTYELINKDYLETMQLNKDELKDYLVKNKILTHPSTSTVVFCSTERDNDETFVYTYTYKVGTIERKIHIIEDYYDSYSISFEQNEYPIIDKQLHEFNESNSNLSFEIITKKCYDENIVFDIKITNNSTEEYTFDIASVADSHVVYRKESTIDTFEGYMNSVVVGESVSNFTITPGMSKNITLSYDVNIKYQTSIIQLWFNNVKSTNGEQQEIGIVL